MTIESSNKHVNALIENVMEVDRLLSIHRQITSSGPGRKHDVQVLHKSAIVLLVACWEAYVEDLAGEALEAMIRKATSHKAFPKFVLERVGSAHSGINSWALAGEGWKRALRGNLKGVLNKTASALNTPRTKQVDDLFVKTIGLSKLSSSWYWPGRSTKQTSEALDNLVTLRGSIAHRVKTAKNVTLKDVNGCRNLIFRLSVKSHNRVCKHLVERVGEAPWLGIQFGKTS